MAGRRRTPTPGTVIAVIALVVAVGGAAYAATKIGPRQLKPNAVRTAKIQDGAVTEPKLADGSVTNPKLADGAVGSAKLDPSERSEAFVTSNPEAIGLNPETGDDFTNADRVALLQLPPGNYVVNASTGIGGSAVATEGWATCTLRDDGAVLSNGAARRVGGARLQGTIALTGASDGGEVDLVCQATVTPTIARFSTITAVRVAAVNTQ